jgi:hypothetical protein
MKSYSFHRGGNNPLNTIGIGETATIQKWLDEMGLENCQINQDLTIDANSVVFLYPKRIVKFPPFIKFNIIESDFICHNIGLKSLAGFPKIIRGHFSCDHNQLSSLLGGPTMVDGNYDCSSNKLTSLNGAPKKVGGLFDCSFNKLTSLKGASRTIMGDFFCENNNMKSIIDIKSEVKLSIPNPGILTEKYVREHIKILGRVSLLNS